MIYLKNHGTVRITKESKLTVTVQSIFPNGFGENGLPSFASWVLSKKHHKGSLFIEGVNTCIL